MIEVKSKAYQLVSQSKIININYGSKIYEEKDMANYIYYILEGEC